MSNKFNEPAEYEALYMQLKSLYSASQEDYEEAMETDYIWQLPYEALKEFIRPIVIVFNATIGLEETVGFIKYYYNNQAMYPKEYQLGKTRYELLKMVISEEIRRKEFESSIRALIEDGIIENNETAWTAFMTEKAQDYIDKIAQKDPTLPKHFGKPYFSLAKDLRFDQWLMRIQDYGRPIEL